MVYFKNILKLISNHKNNYTMHQSFYTDPKIYKYDIQNVWKRNWLFAGHSCELKNNGDYFVYDIDKDSAIISRGKDGKTWWADQVAKCVALDASDGLDCVVVERESNTSGNKMLALETIKPEA